MPKPMVKNLMRMFLVLRQISSRISKSCRITTTPSTPNRRDCQVSTTTFFGSIPSSERNSKNRIPLSGRRFCRESGYKVPSWRPNRRLRTTCRSRGRHDVTDAMADETSHLTRSPGHEADKESHKSLESCRCVERACPQRSWNPTWPMS